MHREHLLDLYTRKLSLQEPVANNGVHQSGNKLLPTGTREFLHARSWGWGSSRIVGFWCGFEILFPNVLLNDRRSLPIRVIRSEPYTQDYIVLVQSGQLGGEIHMAF